MDTGVSPIALFAYRRANHLKKTIESLAANPEARHSDLFVFSDAAKNKAAEHDVNEVRGLLRNVTGFRRVTVSHRSENYGLAHNIVSGVGEVLAGHETVIVVEDDLITSPYFLRFLNQGLVYYRDEPRVGSISGYCLPLDRPIPETFFIRGSDCWGWATWADRWSHFNSDGCDLLEQLRQRQLTKAFDLDGAMGFTRMLEDQIVGRNDSWAVRWHASCFLRDLLMLYPSRSLVVNIGQDGTGTHSAVADDSYIVPLSTHPVMVGDIIIEENQNARDAFRQFFLSSQVEHSPWRRMRQLLSRLIGRG